MLLLFVFDIIIHDYVIKIVYNILIYIVYIYLDFSSTTSSYFYKICVYKRISSC